MKVITVNICICKMSTKNFKKNIMIYKPCERHKKKYIINSQNKNYEVIEYISKYYDKIINEYGLNNHNVYVLSEKTLFKIKKKKEIIELFEDFNTNKINIYIFLNVGGASMHNDGYSFKVHSDEYIHRNQEPHIHVEKNECSTRYSLITFKRYEKDKVCKEILKNEKKKIIPFIKQHQDLFIGWWKKSIQGYEPPIINEREEQYYEES